MCGAEHSGYSTSTDSHHANTPENALLIDIAWPASWTSAPFANPLFGNGFVGNLSIGDALDCSRWSHPVGAQLRRVEVSLRSSFTSPLMGNAWPCCRTASAWRRTCIRSETSTRQAGLGRRGLKSPRRVVSGDTRQCVRTPGARYRGSPATDRPDRKRSRRRLESCLDGNLSQRRPGQGQR